MNLLTVCFAVAVAEGLFSAVQDVGSVQIHDLDVPASVRNGTQASVVLDCDYSYDAAETPGLVVNWYFGARDDPVYQWIPHYGRQQGLGRLHGRLDLNCTADDDKYKRHRALCILQPTTELSGAYTCKVSSLQREDVRTATMLVFAPATNMTLSSVKPSEGTVNVTCHAEGLFPRPELKLFKNRMELKDVILERTRREEGVFDLAVHKSFSHQDLPWETVFQCEVTIPGTDYSEERQLLYYTGGNGAARETGPTTALAAIFTATVILENKW